MDLSVGQQLTVRVFKDSEDWMTLFRAQFRLLMWRLANISTEAAMPTEVSKMLRITVMRPQLPRARAETPNRQWACKIIRKAKRTAIAAGQLRRTLETA